MKAKVTRLYPEPLIELVAEDDLEKEMFAWFDKGAEVKPIREIGYEFAKPFELHLSPKVGKKDGVDHA